MGATMAGKNVLVLTIVQGRCINWWATIGYSQSNGLENNTNG